MTQSASYNNNMMRSY